MRVNLTHGFGINDADYSVKKSVEIPAIDGKRRRKTVWVCPYYQKWRDMISRCYRKDGKEYKSYFDCSVDTRWKKLTDFIKWVDGQPNRDWEKCDLDKDLLFSGNRVYSPDTCVFIERRVNNFFLEASSGSTEYLIGVTWHKRLNKFMAQCCDPFRRKSSAYIGYFFSEIEAHLAWSIVKEKYALDLAETQPDVRVKAVLNNYAEKLRDARKAF